MQPQPSTELKCLPPLPHARSQFLQTPSSFNKGNLSCVRAKCWFKDLFVSPVIQGFFWVRPRWGCFLILPSPLLFSFYYNLPPLHQISVSSVTPNGFSNDIVTQRDTGRKKREVQGLESSSKDHNPWWLWITGVQGGNARGYTGGVRLQELALGARILSCHLEWGKSGWQQWKGLV